MTTAPPSPFGKLLRRQRRMAGVTQEALAERAGLGVNTIRALEAGVNRAPRQETLDLLVEALAAARQLAAAERAALAVDFGAAVRAARGEGERPQASGSVPPLVGRRRELALLEQHVMGEGPPLLFLAGEPGIGKSRLLREAALRAEQAGWQVLEGGCQRRGGQDPYAPLLQAIERHLRRQSAPELRAALQGCAWLVRLLPELADGPIEPLPGWTILPDQERRLLFKAVGRFLANVAGPAGTLLVLDDLQWAGADALDLLGTLVGADAEAPLRVVGAYRNTEVPLAQAATAQPLALLVADLAQADLASHCVLEPLADEEALQLLEALLEGAGEEQAALRRQLLQRVSGVPFFLVSCARGLRAGAPSGQEAGSLPWNVAQSIRQRVAALPDEAQAILGVAAVAGRVVPLALLVASAAQPKQAVLAGLDAACRAQLLEESGVDSYRFVHDVVREVVEADLGVARRTLLYQRVAEALERLPGERPIEALAFHYGRSGDQEKAARYLEEAGDRAWLQRAQMAAEGFYREAVERLDGLGRVLDAARLREKLAAVLGQSAQADAALAELEWAAARYRMAGDLESLGRVAAHIGDLYAQADVPEQGIRLLQPLAALLASTGPSSGRAALYLALTELFYRSGRYIERLEAAERAVEEARALRDRRLLAAALAARGSTLNILARLDESLQAFEEALQLIEASGELDGRGADLAADRSRREPAASIANLELWLLRYEPALILSDAAGALHAKGRLRDAIHVANRAVDLAERQDDPRYKSWTLSIRSLSLFLTGDWEGAWADIERGVAISRQFHLSSRFAGTIVFRGWLHMGLGAWEEAARDLGEAIALGERSGYLQMLRLAHGALAEIEIRQGRPADARVRLLPLLDRPGLEEEDVTQLLPVLAWAHLEMGEPGEADALVQQAIRRARAEGSPLLLTDALRVKGLIAIRQGWWEEAERALDEGLALARSMPYPYAEARLLYLYGLCRTHQGDQGPARERLEAARTIFRRLGARNDLERTEQLVATLG